MCSGGSLRIFWFQVLRFPSTAFLQPHPELLSAKKENREFLVTPVCFCPGILWLYTCPHRPFPYPAPRRGASADASFRVGLTSSLLHVPCGRKPQTREHLERLFLAKRYKLIRLQKIWLAKLHTHTRFLKGKHTHTQDPQGY